MNDTNDSAPRRSYVHLVAETELSAEEASLAKAERASDLLIEAFGAEHAAVLPNEIGDPALASAQEQFFDWLAHDLRMRQRSAEKASATADAVAFADRMVGKIAAAKGHVRCIDGAVAVRPLIGGGDSSSVQRLVEVGVAMRCAPLVELAVAAGAGREMWDQECESWVDLPAEIPPGRFVALRVAGDSMTPLFHSGDTVLVKLGEELARDAIVVARCDDGYVMKQVARVARREMELVSLNPAFAPMRVQRKAGTVLGTVVLRWCEHVRR